MTLDALSLTRRVHEEAGREYRYPTFVRHQGTTIAFAMDQEQRIYYSVLNMSPDPSAQQAGAKPMTLDKEAWSTSAELLLFPSEIADAGFRVIGQRAMPVFRTGAQSPEPAGRLLPLGDRARLSEFDYFRSTTAQFSAPAPFQVLSDGTFVYVFRQSTEDATLLVDRFLLVDRRLESKLEVRFQRSRRKGVPQNKKDTLGARDLDGNPFLEPTQKLAFVGRLVQGRFAVVLVPTHVPGVQRWQIFAENAVTGRMDSINVERSEDGLFNTRGTVLEEDDRLGGESALHFVPSMTLGLSKAIGLPGEWTIEGWLNPDADGPDVQVLARDERGVAAVELVNRQQLRVGGLMGGSVPAGQWTYFAIVVKANKAVIFTGDRRQVAGEAAGLPPNVNTVGGFAGTLDELRVWGRARADDELRRDQHQRLTGLEPGLTAYLRLDEGQGTQVFDQAPNGRHGGTISDPSPQPRERLWPLSGAPLSESAGIERHSFGVDGRMWQAGPSAILYFQQAKAKSGYGREEKRLKQTGRIMLTVPAAAPGGDPQPFMAVFDFGVSGSGRIPRTPDVVTLPMVTPAGSGALSINDQLDQLAEAEEQVRQRAAALSDHQAREERLAKVLQTTEPVVTLNAANIDAISLAVRGAFPRSVDDLAFARLNSLLPLAEAARLELRSAFDASVGFETERVRAARLQLGAAIAAVRNERSALIDRFRATSADLARLQAEAAARAAVLRQQLRAGTTAAMAQVHVDPSGLSIAGGLLAFAWTNDTPRLFDSATGKLALYFRGTEGQFFVTYYQTFTERAKCVLGPVECVAKASERELDLLTVEVSGGDGAVCDVSISGAGISETWRGVPRDAQRFVDVINGVAGRRAKVGTARFSADGKALVEVELTAPLTQGTLLVVGDLLVTTAADAAQNSASVSLEAAPERTVPTEVRPLFRLAYDYRQANTTLPSADLENGSSLVVARTSGNSGRVENRRVVAGPTVSAEWVAEAPGAAIQFDGVNQVAALADATRLNRLNAPEDMTIETWVRPVRATREAVLIEHPDYALKLLPADLRTALQFGAGTEARFPFAQGIPMGERGDFTLEFWVRPNLNVETTRLIQVERFQLEIRVSRQGMVSATYEATTVPGGPLQADLPHHVALVRENGMMALFVNGKPQAGARAEAGRRAGPHVLVAGGDGFAGEMDEIRWWARARSAQQIEADMHRRLTGNETGLRGCWTFPGGVPQDVSRFRMPGQLMGAAKVASSPLTAYQVSATVRGQSATSTSDPIPAGNWTHLAATFERGYALEFDGRDQHLACGEGASLNLPGDLTIEAFVSLRQTGQRQALVRKGRFDGEDNTQRPPYALHVNDRDELVFSFADVKGNYHEFASEQKVTTGFHHLAVTRERKSGKDDHNETASTTTIFDAITLYIDGVNAGVAERTRDVFSAKPAAHKYEGPRVGGDPTPGGGAVKKVDGTIRQPEPIATSNGPMTISGAGKGRKEDGTGEVLLDGWNGSISEVRIWNVARSATEIAERQPLQGVPGNLRGWWRFREREGDTVKDATSNANHGTSKNGARWVPARDPLGSAVQLIVNGTTAPVLLRQTPQTATVYQLGRGLHGEIEETRIWRTARTPEQVQDNLFGRVRDEIQDLMAYYTYDPTSAARTTVPDGSLGLNDLTVSETQFVLSTAPIGEDGPEVRNALAGVRSPFSGFVDGTPAVHEYADAQLDAKGNMIGVFKRVYGYALERKWNLITGYKVGDLDTEWVGQVQFNPELLGYIEGAPPVPGENLTTGSDAAIGDLDDYNGASSVRLTEAEEKTITLSASRDAGIKLSVDAALKFGANIETEVLAAPLGVGVSTKALEVEIAAGPRIQIETAHGFLDEASVAFGLTTAKSTSLELRGRYAKGEQVGVRVPRFFLPDNLGQALVKSETADVFALRLRRPGRPDESPLIAYQFRPNPDIPKDVNLISFRINPRYTLQGSLDGKIGLDAHPAYPNALQRSSDASYFKPLEAYKRKAAIDRKAAELQTLYDQYAARENAHLSRFAAGSLGGRYSPLRESKAKRSLVNTYVWTADGGLFAETQESSDTFVESTGGSFEFSGGLGLDLEGKLSAGATFGYELNVMLTGYYQLEETKSVESKSAYSLEVDIEKVERDIMKRNAQGEVELRNGVAARVAGKVDAYRFMTFRLEPSTDNYEDFFNTVVDPEWLQSSDPGAVALRGARQPGKKPPCWRVLHRVTFVSRVLPEVESNDAPPFVRTMRQLDIDSNYELIKQFEPYVAGVLNDAAAFKARFAERLRALPALLDHEQEILSFLMEHFGVSSESTGSAEGAAFGEDSFRDTIANAPPAVAVLGGASRVLVLEGPPVDTELIAQVTDDRLAPENVFLSWEAEGVGISGAHRNNPKLTFTRRGRYAVAVTAHDGKLRGRDAVTVIVNEPPRLEIAPPGEPRKNGHQWTLQLAGQVTDDGRADRQPDTGSVALKWTCLTSVKPAFGADSQAETTVTFAEPGFYVLQLEARNGNAVGRAEVTIAIAARVTAGLQAFYTFDRPDTDTTVADRSLPGTLGLTRAAGAGLQSAPAHALVEAIQGTNSFSVEAWVTPADASSRGLARIVTLSGGPGRHNFVLAQAETNFFFGVRTGGSQPNVHALRGGTAVNSLVHVVATFGGGLATLYINGREAARREALGSLLDWTRSSRLGVGNEVDNPNDGNPRAFNGTFQLVALYDRALTADEVQQNFTWGARRDLPALVDAGGDRVETSLTTTLRGRVVHDRAPVGAATVMWSGPAGVRIDRPAQLETAVTFPAKGVYTMRLTSSEEGREAVSSARITVHTAPLFKIEPMGTIILTGDRIERTIVVGVQDEGLATPGSSMSFTWSQTGGPEGAAITDPRAKEPVIRFTQRGAYRFRLVVSNGFVQAEQGVSLMVNQPANFEIIAPPAATFSGTEGEVRVALASQVIDSGSTQSPEFTWTAEGPGPVVFAVPAEPSTEARFTVGGVYTIRLKVNQSTVEKTLTVNRAPVILMAAERAIQSRTVPFELPLEAAVSDDGLPRMPGRVSLAWQVTGGGPVQILGADRELAIARFTGGGTFDFRLMAHDGVAATLATTRVRFTTAPTLAVIAAPERATNASAFRLTGAVLNTGLATPPPPGAIACRWSMSRGPGNVVFSSPAELVTDAQVDKSGDYEFELAVTNGVFESKTKVAVRVVAAQAGQVLGFDFRNGTSSDTGLELVVSNLEAVRIGPAGLQVLAPVTIQTAVSPNPVLTSILEAGAFTLEGVVRPSSAAGTGRILGFGRGPEWNMLLEHRGEVLRLSLRSTAAHPPLVLESNPLPGGPLHVAVTADAGGRVVLFVNGQAETHNTQQGLFEHWDPRSPLGLSGDGAEDAVWLGLYRMLAVYRRAMSPTEIGEMSARSLAFSAGV